MDKEQKSKLARALCKEHGCSDKTAKLHFKQIVLENWQPHPPPEFVSWWGSIGIEATEKATNRGWRAIDAVRAFNCEAVREVYREHKKFGIDATLTSAISSLSY